MLTRPRRSNLPTRTSLLDFVPSRNRTVSVRVEANHQILAVAPGAAHDWFAGSWSDGDPWIDPLALTRKGPGRSGKFLLQGPPGSLAGDQGSRRVEETDRQALGVRDLAHGEPGLCVGANEGAEEP